MERASDGPSEGSSEPRSAWASSEKLVAWLRAPAFAPNALSLPDAKSLLAGLSLGPVLFVAFTLVALTLVFTTETYMTRNGIGDDGVIYAAILRNFDGHIGHLQSLGLNGYSAQRCLNPIMIRTVMNMLKMSTGDASVVLAYKVANAISIAIAIACGIDLLRHLRLSRAGLLTATSLAFFNFMTLYWLPFDPVLVDAMALAIGCLQVWAYLSRQYVILAIVSAFGGFIWPSATQVGAAMLFFPRPPEKADQATVATAASLREGPSSLDLALAAGLTGLITWWASTTINYVPPYGQAGATRTLFRLSCAAVCFVTFFGLKELIRIKPSLRELARVDLDALTSKVMAVVILVVVSRGVKWISIAPTTRLPQADDFSVADVVKSIFFYAVQRPLIHVFAHVGYFGAGVMLMFWCWRSVCNESRRLGFGMNAALGMSFLMLYNSQSRGAIELFPIMIPLATLAAARLPWTPRRLIELAALQFVCSKLWYAIVQRPKFDYASFMDHVGPWMSNDSYVAHGILTIGVSIWVLWMSRQTPRAEEAIWLTEEQPRFASPS